MLADEIQELREEIRALKQTLQRIVAVGEVVEVDEALHRVRVKLLDRDVITGFLHVLVPVSHQTYFYGLPKVGDTVLCVFLPHGIEDGFVVGSYYHRQEEAPVKDRNKFYKRFADGTVIEYDEAVGKLAVENPKELGIEIRNTSSLTSPTVTIKGDVMIEGNLNVTGNITSIGQTTAQSGLKTSPDGQTIFVDDLVSKYNSHTHTDSSGGSTSVPDQQLP